MHGALTDLLHLLNGQQSITDPVVIYIIKYYLCTKDDCSRTYITRRLL